MSDRLWEIKQVIWYDGLSWLSNTFFVLRLALKIVLVLYNSPIQLPYLHAAISLLSSLFSFSCNLFTTDPLIYLAKKVAPWNIS